MAKREVCIVQSHSPENAELAALTLSNHWDYAVRHGYDFSLFVEPWQAVEQGAVNEHLERLLPAYEHLFFIGSDVLFTHPEIPLSKFYDEDHGAVVALCGAPPACIPIIFDTIILNNNAKGHYYLRRLKQVMPARFGQAFTVDLMRDEPGIVTAKRIQGLPWPCPVQWTPDDFCIHFFCGNLQNKLLRLRAFLKDGTVILPS